MLIAVHTDLSFAFLKALLDGPAHDRSLYKFQKRYPLGRIRNGVFNLAAGVFSEEQPLRCPHRQPVAGQVGPDAGHLGDDRPLGALGDHNRFPGKQVSLGDFGYFSRLGLPGQYPNFRGPGAAPFIIRKTKLRLFDKDQGVGLDGCEVIAIPGKGILKFDVFPKRGIGTDPLRGEKTRFVDFMDQVEGDL